MNTTNAEKTAVATAGGNLLELNQGDQFIIGLDISQSMATRDCGPNLDVSRIAYTLETCEMLVAEASKYDPDGISFYPFGASVHAFRDLQPADIHTKLSNIQLEPATQTHLAIREAFKEHQDKKNEQTFLFIFTDGDPSDRNAVEKAIIDITNKVKDPMEFRIGFLLVGKTPSSLADWLADVDDNLTSRGAKYDIVKNMVMEKTSFIEMITGALAG